MSNAEVESSRAVLASVAGVLVIGVVDWATGHEIRVFPLYFLPVAYAARTRSRKAVVGLGLASSASWALANWHAGADYSSWFIWPVNIAAQLVAFLFVGLLVVALQRSLASEQSLGRTDTLTRLLNGRAFYEQAELLLAVARRSGRPATLAYLDLDDFKKVNDRFGHQQGDRALQETAAVLCRFVRASDLAARLGGDEFVLFLTDAGADSARSSLERIRDQVAAAMQRNGWPATISVGAVTYVTAPPRLDAVIKAADAVMYKAKQGGKNRVLVEQVAATGSIPVA